MLGPVKGKLNDIVPWVLKYNGNAVPWLTLGPLNAADIHSPVNIKKIYTFDSLIDSRWGTEMDPLKTNEPEVKE